MLYNTMAPDGNKCHPGPQKERIMNINKNLNTFIQYTGPEMSEHLEDVFMEFFQSEEWASRIPENKSGIVNTYQLFQSYLRTIQEAKREGLKVEICVKRENPRPNPGAGGKQQVQSAG